MRHWRLFVVGIVTAISVIAVSSAASATQALSYSRLAVRAFFSYDIDYGSNPDSTFNGYYHYSLLWDVNAIAVYDGRRVSVLNNSMLADGGATMIMDMTQWRAPPSSRRRVRCPKPGSEPGSINFLGQLYDTDEKGGRFSGVAVSGSRTDSSASTQGGRSSGQSAAARRRGSKPMGWLAGRRSTSRRPRRACSPDRRPSASAARTPTVTAGIPQPACPTLTSSVAT